MPTAMPNMVLRKVFQCILTTTVQSDSQVLAVSSMSQCSLNTESYRQALQQFKNHHQLTSDLVNNAEFLAYSPHVIRQNNEYTSKEEDNCKCRNDWKLRKQVSLIPGVPHVRASEIFEIGCVAGTEDRYLEMICAEWHNTRVSLRRHTHPACQGAIAADIEVLTEIRHPNILLLMATTHTDEHGLISILEPIECTLYNYIHEQGERISIREIVQMGMKLADALKYCHMRGYIHGAISSHCVYFTFNGTLKLGGWELTITTNGSGHRDYEECLRTEIFKWQAPEFFHGFPLSTKSDVYGLSLLLWEMGTRHVPWIGCNRPHIERQYASQKRIVMDLRAFPSCLQSLLENGLQLDVTKRTLDMDKIQKILHRILMSKEEEETRYINEQKNNNKTKDAYTMMVNSVPSTEDIKLIKSPTIRQPDHHITEKKSSNKSFKSKKIQCNRDLNHKTDIKQETFLINDDTARSATQQQAITSCSRAKVLNLVEEHNIDEELPSIARSNIKQLKEFIANKREHFFHESSLPISSYKAANSKDTITFSGANNNPNYVQCKPASHATNIELKCRKSPSEYQGTITKPLYAQQHKASYTNMPASIRDAIMQRKILYSDPQSFYESTLWRKEKMICLSRMAWNNEKYKQMQSSSQQSVSYINTNTDNEKIESLKPNPISRDDKFIIKHTSEGNNNYINDTETRLLQDIENNPVPVKVLDSSDNSLQNLSDALDRATEIIHSITPRDECSLLHSETCNFEDTKDNMQKYENAYDDLYDERKHDSERDIKIIKRSLDNNSFMEADKYTSTKDGIAIECKKKSNQEHFATMRDSTHINKFHFKSIIEVPNESQISIQDQQLENVQISDHEEASTNKITSNPQKAKVNFTTEGNFKLNERKLMNLDNILSPSIARCEKCNSNNLLRRLSLPAKLNQMEETHSSILRRKYAHKKHSQNDTIEDLYIDDEFGSRLNDNLVLLSDDLYLLNDCLYDNQ